MNPAILHKDVQEFIRNFKDESAKLAFSGSPFSDVSAQELLQQIESRRKIEKKLPTWFQQRNILYPPKLNLEQTSSEIAAKYKASLIVGDTLADVTGGFGVDSYFFASSINHVDHFEVNQELSKIAKHNFGVLQKNNIYCRVADGIQAITNTKYDNIYVDPSRRASEKGKVFFLNDCEPNVAESLDLLLNSCKTLLIKTSPMLDISIGMAELDNVVEVHIVAIDNEVKEVLWLLRKNHQLPPIVKTIDFNKKSKDSFNFELGQSEEVTYAEPQNYLYEPNAAILKSGAFTQLCREFNVHKLAQHTHLYTSAELKAFPGRVFKIKKVIPYHKKEMRAGINFDKANVAIRNFPESVKALRKRWKIKDGGDIYLFFTTLSNDKKMMLLCAKI